MSGEGLGEFGFNTYQQQQQQLSGQKRGFSFSGRGGSPDRFDRGSFAKLFVGSVPRTATEEDIRPLFEQHGNVIEVALIKDKRTGQHQGCCFIKYATSEDADQAIRALHNQHTLPGGIGPIQVRYADGERERLGAVEYKLFVGSLNKQATVKEVEEIFSKYGRVEDVYLMRDEMKQSRGCGFVKYSNRDMALSAINALNGIYTMRGCDQPLIVRFADPKRPRQGDSRGPTFGDPGSGPRFDPPGARFPPNTSIHMDDRMPPPNAWRPMHPSNMRQSSNADNHGMETQWFPRSGDTTSAINAGGPMTGMGGPIDGRFKVESLTSMSQQNFIQPLSHIPPLNQEISPLQKPVQSSQELPPAHQLHPEPQAPMPYSQIPSQSSLRLVGQPQLPLSAGKQGFSTNGQFPTSQSQNQQSAVPASNPRVLHDTNFQPNTQQVPHSVQQQPLQPHQQSPSQLAQMLSHQKQTLQASLHSSQQVFSQLQQQVQMMQPSSQTLTMQQNAAIANKQQASNSTAAPIGDLSSSTSATTVAPGISQNMALAKCNWTEHLSPEGFKYYYNSVTGESRWEKPEELALSEKQQQRLTGQHSQTQSQPSMISTHQVPQMQQAQLQSDFQGQILHQQQMQQPSVSSLFQAYGVTGPQNGQDVGYKQLQASAISAGDHGRYSQGIHTTQDWMWKNKAAGYLASSHLPPPLYE